MATEIPIFTARTRVPSAGGPPAPVLQNPQAAAGTGLALNRAAADLEKIGERVQAGVRVRALADATTALGALQTELDGTNDPAALGPLVLQRRQQIEAQVRERLGSDAEGLDLVNARLADNFSALTRAAAARGRALESDAFKATIVESGRELAARAAAGGEGVNSTAVRDYTAMLDAGVAGGRITRLEAATLAQRFRADVEGAQVLRLVRDQPGAVATVLSDPSRFTSLSAQERERYITAAAQREQTMIARGVAASERAQRDADRRLKAQQEENSAALFARIQDGMLGRGPAVGFDEIDEMRRSQRISADDATAARRSLVSPDTAGPRRDDPIALRRLTQTVDVEDPEVFERNAGRLMENGYITPQTYTAQVERNRSARRDDAPESPYRRGRTFVREALDPGDVPMNEFMRQSLTTAQQRAIDEYDTWIDAQRQAGVRVTAMESMFKADELVRRYGQESAMQTRAALPMPPGFSGLRSDVKAADIARAKERLAADLEAGRITPDQAVQQGRMLRDWEALLARLDAAQAAQTQQQGGPRGRAPAPRAGTGQ